MEQLTKLIETLVTTWVGGLEQSGYLGIFILMTIESSFIPFPSEIIMLPAGVLAAEGKLNLYGAIAAGVAGSLAGGLFNYFFALYLGRAFLLKYGKYVFVSPDQIEWAESVWQKHGELTTLVCRLLPAIRQIISLPAGLARMNLFRFCLWTTIGAGLWVIVLTVTGYWLGPSAEKLWSERKVEVTIGLFVAAFLLAVTWLIVHRVRSRPKLAGDMIAEAIDKQAPLT
jgi:membrane protein DedA with SNARE-associated domain